MRNETAVYSTSYKTSKIILLLKDSKLDKLDPRQFVPWRSSQWLPWSKSSLSPSGSLHEYSWPTPIKPPWFLGPPQCDRCHPPNVYALENGEMVGRTLVDLSAAFDCVDVDLLIEKTKL